ncbi:MAG: aminotransferase class III-fold pyridoxal phosphate-dependent enzyme [Spirochaetales bacterium]|nr:aminotransferase class III-fold pyridoxal phosphate-dependent enzyme [Spirochaetales bacterium]
MNDLNNIPTNKENLDKYEVDNIYHSWGYQSQNSPMRVVGAKGLRFTTEDGRERLDFSSCFVSHNIGHQDQRVIDAICRQAQKLTSFAPSFSTEPRAVLGKILEEVTPGDLSYSFISLGGTEANEAAIKIAQQYTGKRKILGRYRSYHGGTGASMSVSCGDPRSWAVVSGKTEVVPVPQPYVYRWPFSDNPTEVAEQCIKCTEQIIQFEGGDEQIAAIIFEPITGANGIIVPPDEYFPRLRELCDKYGILMIADEVMTGFGRTGKWFAMDHWNTVPDIMSMAKGITSGYVPMGNTITTKKIGKYFQEQMFSHGATYAGHALGCAAAAEVIKIYQTDNLIENSAVMGEYLLEKSKELMEKHPVIGDVRGKGLFVGLELVKNRTTKEPLIPLDAKIRKGMNPKLELAKRLGELGMMAMAANPSNVVALAPALIATKADIDEGISIMDEALKSIDHYAEQN